MVENFSSSTSGLLGRFGRLTRPILAGIAKKPEPAAAGDMERL
jgi:hypothetical protein